MLPHACTGLTSSSKHSMPTVNPCTFWSNIRDVMSITELPAVYSQITLCGVWLLTCRLEANVSFSMSQQNLPRLNHLSTCTCSWRPLNHGSTQRKISLTRSLLSLFEYCRCLLRDKLTKVLCLSPSIRARLIGCFLLPTVRTQGDTFIRPMREL